MFYLSLTAPLFPLFAWSCSAVLLAFTLTLLLVRAPSLRRASGGVLISVFGSWSLLGIALVLLAWHAVKRVRPRITAAVALTQLLDVHAACVFVGYALVFGVSTLLFLACSSGLWSLGVSFATQRREQKFDWTSQRGCRAAIA